MSVQCIRHRSRSSVAGALVAAVALLGAAAPAGAAPAKQRYKDLVFAKASVTKDVQYGQAPGPDGAPVALKLDLYQPKGDAVAKRPAVIWVHGGGFANGDKSTGPAADLAKRFARLGYVTASINYRLLGVGCEGGGITPACYAAAIEAVHDGQAAVRFLRAKAKTYRIDPTRIAIGGESAGAITSTGVAVLSADPGKSGNPGFSSAVGGFVSISGGLPDGLFVDKKTAPGLLFHGTADTLVPLSWSVATRDKMRTNGVRADLVTLQGAGHVPWAQYQGQMERTSTTFLYDVLRAGKAAGAKAGK